MSEPRFKVWPSPTSKRWNVLDSHDGHRLLASYESRDEAKEDAEVRNGVDYTGEHIYNKIRVALEARKGWSFTFNEVEAACERAKQDGICIQTYATPSIVAEMLDEMSYL